MGRALERRLLQHRFEGPHHEAILNLLVVAAYLRARTDQLCTTFGITEAQYNVLRILRGVSPGGYPRHEIGRRMIDRAPDVTRLIDRMQRQGLVERARSNSDRRLSLTRITRKGMMLLDRMQQAVDELQRSLSERLQESEARELSRLCELIYEEPETA